MGWCVCVCVWGELILNLNSVCWQSKSSISRQVVRLDKKRKTQVLRGNSDKVHRIMNWDDTCWSLILQLPATKIIVFNIQLKMELCCLLNLIKDLRASFLGQHGSVAPAEAWRKDFFIWRSEAVTATSKLCEPPCEVTLLWLVCSHT